MPYTLPEVFWMPRTTQGKPYVTTGALAAPPYVQCIQASAIKPPAFNPDAWDELDAIHSDDTTEEPIKMLIEWAMKVKDLIDEN